MKRTTHSKAFRWIIAAILVILVGLNKPITSAYVPCHPGGGGDLKTSGPATLTVTVDVQQKRQTIKNFGASDCWSIQYVGQWPLVKRQAIADLLFEVGLDADDNPKGIGLSLWRFNIGAGSNRQSYISERWHRTDTFLSADYTDYDWSAQPGQRWFLQAAKERGVERFLAFVNSPPINMTKNSRAYCDSSSGTTNLRADKINDFAAFLSTIMQHFTNDEGIVFDYISPFNEPNWDWNGNSQEGCRYCSSDMKAVVDALYTELKSRGVSTQIIVPEAASYANLYEPPGQNTGHIDAFFDQNSQWFISDKVARTVTGHGYFSMWPEWDDRLVGWRETLRSKLNEYPGLEYWMSELCLWIPNESWVPPEHRDYGLGRDLGIDPALWVARTIHYDMTVGEATGWQWWLAASPYDYKDGLVYVDRNDYDGEYYQSKMLWAMGNFSRFIRPGMKRVAVYRSDNATPDDTVYDLMVSGYYKNDDGIVVVVFVNWAYESKPIDLNFLGAEVTYLIPYVTAGYSLDTDNLTAYSALSPGDTIAIPARSIVTIVGLPENTIDCNKDGKINFGDFVILAAHWLQTHCAQCSGADLSGDGRVNIDDTAVLAENWLADFSFIAHWKLDETEGSIAHDSAVKKNGTLNGGPLWQPDGGKVNGALQFDGTDDYVSTPFVLNPSSGPFTAIAWVKGGAPGQVVISQTNIAIWLGTDSSYGKLLTRLKDATPWTAALISEFVITDGDWHRVGFVWDGVRRHLYADGAEVAKDNSNLSTLVSSDKGMYIGAGPSLAATNFWSGLIDDVFIYDRAVTP